MAVDSGCRLDESSGLGRVVIGRVEEQRKRCQGRVWSVRFRREGQVSNCDSQQMNRQRGGVARTGVRKVDEVDEEGGRGAAQLRADEMQGGLDLLTAPARAGGEGSL